MLVQFRFNSFEEFAAEYSVNLSTTGIFICAEDCPEVGAAVYLQFLLPDDTRLIEGLGRVARVVQADPTTKTAAGFAIQFVDFDEQSLEVIRRVCEGKETNAK